MMRRAIPMLLLTIGLAAGCVERRFVLNSDPPGALAYHNGIYLGHTPVDGYITYYGKQQFRLILEGYETLDVVQKYPPPWYELPGVDFFSENIYPFKVRDVRSLCYTMRPLQTIRPDDVRDQAEQLRRRGQSIGAPLPPRPLVVPPGAVPVPNGAPPAPPPDLPSPRVLPPEGAVPAGASPLPPPGPPAVPPPAPPPVSGP